MNPYRTGRNGRKTASNRGYYTRHHRFRNVYKYRRRENIGVVNSKTTLKTSLLNVDGLSDASLVDIEDFVLTNRPDVVFILETKRRLEELAPDISLQGYDDFEVRRSDAAGDGPGGGIACYTREADGLVIRRYLPEISLPQFEYVNKERVWLTVDSLKSKTAILGVYMGCQYPDDRHGEWNDGIYWILRQEITKLRSEGYRIQFLGDMNGHVGSVPGQGIVGNNPDINRNGQRFLDFLAACELQHINGAYKTPGQPATKICQGLWTRQRGNSRSVIDFAGVSADDLGSVVSMHVDDAGIMGGNSDHNWISLVVNDKFRRLKIPTSTKNSHKWNIGDDQDWTEFKADVLTNLSQLPPANNMTVNELATKLGNALYSAGPKLSKKLRSLPSNLVAELKKKREFESTWKSLSSSNANGPASQAVAEAEEAWLAQKCKVSKIFAENRHQESKRILEDRSAFWSAVSGKVKQSSDISAVLAENGVLKCDPDDIKILVENHLCSVFNGSVEPVVPDTLPPVGITAHQSTTVQGDHSYASNPSPMLPSIPNSDSIDQNPSNWLDKRFTKDEVKEMAMTLLNNKACGFDRIPNEFIKNAPDCLFSLLAILFNKIRDGKVFPEGWSRGRITLVHKRGLRVLLSNYRPITVLISMAGLYSKVLNARLTRVVERHGLLGEIQGGFRKGRGGSDNTFLLNTIFWKARAAKQSVHLGFLDITKAYDSVNRNILWRKLESIGITGKFLDILKSMYTGDTVESVVNGVRTRPVYLKRGLRQGCSLSPILFNLYISDIGHDLTVAGEGFEIGKGVNVSGLLFADDIVLISKTADGLKRLLNLVNKHCEDLKLIISEEKSQVVSPTDDVWDIFGEGGLVVSLRQILQYKYLGTQTFSSIFRTFAAKQKKCVDTAKKYMYGCLHLGKQGSDLIKVASTTWEAVAVPSIMFGCETVLFSETKISELETIQSQVAKQILGVSRNTSNICAQTELGFKPIRLVLALCQLQFYFRVLRLPNSRWVKIALLNHLAGTWHSPYLTYITKLRAASSLYEAPPSLLHLRRHLFEWALFKTNLTLSSSSLTHIQPLLSFRKALYVCPSKHLNIIASFKLLNAQLGNKAPLTGLARMETCPHCPIPEQNNEEHLLFVCPYLQNTRVETGLDTFRTHCALYGFSTAKMFGLFVNGRDVFDQPVPLDEYLERGATLAAMRSAWLQF